MLLRELRNFIYFRFVFVFLALVFCRIASADVGDAHIATWYKDATAAYTLTHDDSFRPDQEIMANALSERGLVGTFFVNPGKPCWETTGYGWDRPAKEVYSELAFVGHELGSHTMNHQSVLYGQDRSYAFETEQDLREDCERIKSVLDKINQKSTQSFAYPWGQADLERMDIISEYFLTGRRSGFNCVNATTPPNMMNLKTFSCGAMSTYPSDFSDYDVCISILEDYTATTLASGAWGIEQYHDLNTAYKLNETAYFEHLDLLQVLSESNQLWVATQGDVARYLYSRDAANIEILHQSDTCIEMRVDDGLDDALYDVPLTVISEIPEDWAAADSLFVFQGDAANRAAVYFDEGKAYASFEVIADGTAVQLRNHVSAISLAGGLNGDLCVGYADLDTVRTWWGEEVAPGDCSCGDASGDGHVGRADLDIVRACWGMQFTVVPEPTVGVLLVLLAVLGMCSRRV